MIRKSMGTVLTVAVAVFLAAPAVAQEGHTEMTPEQQAEMDAHMKAGTPGAEHLALASTTGNYAVVVQSWHEPDGPATEETGTTVRTMELDGRVRIEKFSGTMMGMPFSGHGMMGFENVTGKYWSTWTDSMSTGMMVSEGTCDAKKSCTFTGSWNDPITKKPVTARMTTRWPSPTTEIFEMYAPGKDGKEMKMMQLTYTKK